MIWRTTITVLLVHGLFYSSFASKNIHYSIKSPNYGVCGIIPSSCPDTCYRSINGSCNNLKKPHLGTPTSAYARLLPAKYGDHHSSPPISVSGHPLPNTRKVSVTVYPDSPSQLTNPESTLLAMQYGQFVHHDMGFTLLDHITTCCTKPRQLFPKSPDHCFEIVVSSDDPTFSLDNITCLPFVKTTTDKDRNCIGNRAQVEQLNSVTSFLDLSHVYGFDDLLSAKLRTFEGGKLIIKKVKGLENLPKIPDNICPLFNFTGSCYLGGDLRINQNPQLTIIQTIYVREHNRLARELAKINPHWEDECLFQEARKINIAQHQYLSYYKYLPFIIDKGLLLKNKILHYNEDHVDDYDPGVDPSTINEHATAASRFFHTSIAGELELFNENRIKTNAINITDFISRPWLLLDETFAFGELTRGLCTQPDLKADEYHAIQITTKWAKQTIDSIEGRTYSEDLKSIDIQRSRNHGIASYSDMRELCGLPKADKFSGFLDTISMANVDKLSSLYEDPNDVELTVGGSLEKLVPGNRLGPTFLCIFLKQFYRTRVGDRFWFENPGKTGFTLGQLQEIRKASFSRIICDNVKSIRKMQPDALLQISPFNKLVSCDSDHIPHIDLSLWKDATQKKACCSKESKPYPYKKKNEMLFK